MRAFLIRPEPWVFAILFGSSAYFWQARDWNISSRLMLTYALVDRGTLSIDGLENQTRDLARYRGHYFSDKTPGLSLLAVPSYAASKWAFGFPDHPLDRPGFAHWPADYWMTLATSGLCTALVGVVLVSLARGLGCGPRTSALVGLAYGLSTPAFAYSTLAYGHQVSALGLIAGFALIRNDSARPAIQSTLAGLLASYASLAEIQVGPVSALIGLYLLILVVLRRRPLRSVVGFGLGAALPAAFLLGYNFLAFDSPWRMGYFYEVLVQFKDVHSSGNPLGLRWPDWSRWGDLLWRKRRGLIRFAPIVILTPPGLLALLSYRQFSCAIVSSLAMALIFLVNLSYPEWTGGWSTGPRLLVPLLPFAMIPVAGILARWGRWAMVPALFLTLAGWVVILGFVAVGGRIPSFVDRPWLDGVWPLIRGDVPLPDWVYGERFARNGFSVEFPGIAARLPRWAGWVGVLPLVAFQAVMIGLMTRIVGRAGRSTLPPP